METREVKVVSGQFDGYKSIQSSASTWEALQEDFDSNEINYVDKRIVLNQGKVDLVDGEATLPEGPIHIFIYASKVKSGTARTAEDLMTENYNTLRSLGSNLGLTVSGSKQDIADRLAEYYRGETGSNNQAEAAAANEDLIARVASMEEKIDKIHNIVSNQSSNTTSSDDSSEELSEEDEDMLAEFERVSND